MKKFLLTLVFSIIGLVSINAIPTKNYNVVVPPTIEIVNDSVFNKANKPIYRYLEIKNDQKKMFNDIHNDLYRSIKYLNENKELATDSFKMHLNHDLYLSQMILTKEQYHKYLRVLNVTLANKNLTKYVN